jgi:hypothetical protein
MSKAHEPPKPNFEAIGSFLIESGSWRPEWKVKKRRGPKTRYELERITRRLAEIGDAPPVMSIPDQAKRVGAALRTFERYLAERRP